MLESLCPNRVFYYFEQISKIPRGSGNLDFIVGYLVEFAKQHHLDYATDSFHNVIIKKPSSIGLEGMPAVIIQGHIDMVVVKTNSCQKDLSKEGLDLTVDGDFVFAKETSLGADDGVAVAFALALLESDSILHPNLEVVLTADEETGMEGATGISLNALKGTQLINIDSETEGEFVVGCAGGVRLHAMLQNEYEELNESCDNYLVFSVQFEGFLGGHSGNEIHKRRGNTIELACKLLADIQPLIGGLIEIEGGEKDNAIALGTRFVGVVSKSKWEMVEREINRFEEKMKQQLIESDPNAKIVTCILKNEEKPNHPIVILNQKSLSSLVESVNRIPNGVITCKNGRIDEVTTSLNLGIVQLSPKGGQLTILIRSVSNQEKENVLLNCCQIFDEMHVEYQISGNYPAWEERQQSVLCNRMKRVYLDLFHKEPTIKTIHAGLECGILIAKKPDLDCISFGPNIPDIHTTKERLSISSTNRMWNFLLEYLARKE